MNDTTTNVEDSIKIALDAADMATSAASELDRIRNDNLVVRAEMKKVYRNMTIVLLSAFAGSAISILAASIVYYKTLSGMETANNTSLEALVIFAENVDKLTAATTSVQDISGKLGAVSADTSKALDSIASLDSKLADNQSVMIARVDALQEHFDGSVSQFSRSVLDDVSSSISTQSAAVDLKLGELVESAKFISERLGGSTDPQGPAVKVPVGLTATQIDEIIASLQKILIAQATITGKLNGMKLSTANANGSKPQVKPEPRPSTDGMIKFP